MDIWRVATCGHGLHRHGLVDSDWADRRVSVTCMWMSSWTVPGCCCSEAPTNTCSIAQCSTLIEWRASRRTSESPTSSKTFRTRTSVMSPPLCSASRSRRNFNWQTFVRSVRLKIGIHEIHEIQQICEIYLSKYRNPEQLCEIHWIISRNPPSNK